MDSRIIISLLFLCFAGCEPSSITITSNGISYEMPFQKQTAPDPGIITNSADKTPHTGFTFIGEFITFKEFDDNLTVNGKDFGIVKPGDKVRLNRGGEVFVNGSSRTPK